MLLYYPGRAVTAQRLCYFYIDNSRLKIGPNVVLLVIIEKGKPLEFLPWMKKPIILIPLACCLLSHTHIHTHIYACVLELRFKYHMLSACIITEMKLIRIRGAYEYVNKGRCDYHISHCCPVHSKPVIP